MQAADTTIKALWIPMDADAADAPLTTQALLDFSTGSIDLSEADYAGIAAAIAEGEAMDPTQMAHYRESVRLLVLYHGNIQMVSDGCRLVDLKRARSVALPPLLVEAINVQPPRIKRWSCRE